MDNSSVTRWVKSFKDGNARIADQPRWGRPSNATNEINEQKVDAFIKVDRSVWRLW